MRKQYLFTRILLIFLFCIIVIKKHESPSQHLCVWHKSLLSSVFSLIPAKRPISQANQKIMLEEDTHSKKRKNREHKKRNMLKKNETIDHKNMNCEKLTSPHKNDDDADFWFATNVVLSVGRCVFLLQMPLEQNWIKKIRHT